MYTDKERGKEAQRERTRRYREKAKGVTEVVEDVTPVRLNPRTGRGYGPGMRAMSDEVLSSYEHHWGAEPIYGEGEVSSWQEVIDMQADNPEKLRKIVGSVCGMKGLGDEIRFGVWGPTYSEIERVLL